MGETEREVAQQIITDEQLCQEAFVLARGAIRQTTAMRKQGGSDEEITMLCDLLKEYDRIVKSELFEHLLPRITTARQQQREADEGKCVAQIKQFRTSTLGDSFCTGMITGAEECLAAIRAEGEA